MAKLCAAGVTLRNQINKEWPKRDKSSDGWIGDAAHAARDGWGTNGKGSFHNPDPRGIVHAIDVDESFGPGWKKGTTAKKFAEELATYCREGKDNGRIAHIVYEDQVASATKDNWNFRGSGFSHFQHIHISFTNKADFGGKKFFLPMFEDEFPVKKAPVKSKPSKTYPGRNRLDFGSRNGDVKDLQKKLISKGFKIPAGPTGFYGSQTTEAVKAFYASLGKNKNGMVFDPSAWKSLWS